MFKDRVILFCCAVIFLMGFFAAMVVGLDGVMLSSVLSYISSISNVVTVIAFFWALSTYRDWTRAKETTEYNTLIELGKSLKKVINALQWYANSMTTSQYNESITSEIEKRIRYTRITHAHTMFFQSIDNYESSRAISQMYDSEKSCNQTYDSIDSIMRLAMAIFYEVESENLQLTYVQGELKDNHYPLHRAFKIPKELEIEMKELGFTDNAIIDDFFSSLQSHTNNLIREQMQRIES